MRLAAGSTFGLLLVCVVFCGPDLAYAQDPDFELEPATAGLPLRVDLAQVLRERYGMRLESDSSDPRFAWGLEGQAPPGLEISEEGLLEGLPEEPATEPHRIAPWFGTHLCPVRPRLRFFSV